MQSMSISALRASTDPSLEFVYITDNLKEGVFKYTGTSGPSDDDAMVIIQASGSRRFRRIYDDKVNVQWFGAIGDGVTDDTVAFQNAASFVSLQFRLDIDGPSYRYRGEAILYIPSGRYLITNSNALLAENTIQKKSITILGCGNGSSEIFYRNTTNSEPLLYNTSWQWLRVKSLLFTCDTENGIFFHSDAKNAAQNYLFEDVGFVKWGMGFNLTGTNNNSEFTFNSCDMSQFMGPFLFVGTTNTADQFLNYRINNCQWWSTDAPFFIFNKGGHININNLDVSDWGRTLTDKAFLFELRGASHARGVCHFTCTNLRIEAKNSNAALIYSEWPQGNVTFDGLDLTSQISQYTYGEMIRIFFPGTDGPCYVFKNFELVGTISINIGTESFRRYLNLIKFSDGVWLNKEKPSDVVLFNVPVNKGGTPIVQFRNVRPNSGGENGYPDAVGYNVWDSDIGIRDRSFGEGGEIKTITIRPGSNGLSTPSFTQKINFPVSSIIVGFKVLNNLTGTGENNDASFLLQTQESTPELLSKAFFSSLLTQRASVEASSSLPFFANTEAKSNLEIKADSDFNTANSNLVYVIEYI